MAALPHRYPMLLVDRVEELVAKQLHCEHPFLKAETDLAAVDAGGGGDRVNGR